MKKYFVRLNDVQAYKRALTLSNKVWNRVKQWDYLAQKTIGDQFIRSVDSISANIVEGFGRYFKKDKIKFYRYSNGSIYESYDWCYKANQRNLVSNEEYDYYINELRLLEKELNGFIKLTNTKLQK